MPDVEDARVVVAVVSYETRELLARCLEALAGEPRVEVWVVDNGSQDGSAAMVRERFPGVRLEAREDNLGFGRAVNLVAERAGDWTWLAIANADTEVRPGAMEALLAAAGADPSAGALAPRLVLPDGSTQHSVHAFWSPAFALRFNAAWHRVSREWAEAACLPGFWDPERGRRVPWALGAFLLVRREAWAAAGGFDPGQWLYAEDVDLAWRLAQSGWATRYVPAAVVGHHESAATGARWGEARDERWMAASYDWLLGRQGPVRARTVALVNVLGSAARGLAGPRRRAARHWARLHTVGLRRRETLRRRVAPPG